MYKDFDDNENVKVDSGIDIEDLEDFEDFESDDTNEDVGAQEQPQDDKKAIKKTSLIAATVGFIIIVVAISTVTIINKKKNSEKYKQQTNIETEQTSKNNDTVANQQNIVGQANDNKESWFEISADENSVFNISIDSNFSVTSIKHFAKYTNENKDLMIKSIVTGNVSGLVGTYEIEIPYSRAINLKVGSVIEIQYSLSDKNNVKIIDNIVIKR